MRTFTSKRARARSVISAAIFAAATAAGWFTARSPLGEQLELRTYDYRFRLKETFPDSTSAPITLLVIDERSLEHIPDPLMLWHRHVATILNYLVEGEAAVVAIDIIFPSIERFDADGQRALAEALIRSNASAVPVILTYRVLARGVEQPPPALAMAGRSFGYANLTVDTDDFVRRQTIQQIGDDGTMQPGLALAVASAFTKRNHLSLTHETGCDAILINYMPRGTFPRVSFSDALDAARNGDLAFFRARFQGRIVLIARLSQRGGDDLHPTPLYYSAVAGSPDGFRTPGVEIHANTVATLIDGRPLSELGWPRQVLVIGLTALVFALAWGHLRLRLALAVSLVFIAALAVFVCGAFLRGAWVWTIGPASAAGFSLVLTLSANYFLEGREKHRIRTLFKGYVNDAVIAQLLERPEEVVLRGERRRIAVLFADIKGFTTMSETASPERVVRLLNEYFDVIIEVIQSHGGTVTSLMGDGLMAIFGAPIRDADAALHAVDAARDVMTALERVNKSMAGHGLTPIKIGIGINSGEAIVGNMGSTRKMEYTATGDVVNTAARIEAQTRAIAGADILISDDVYQWIAGRITAEFVTEAALKGRSAPVRLYRVPWTP